MDVSDDPYYCGLRARVPNFVKSKTKVSEPVPSKRFSVSQGGSGVVPPRHLAMAAHAAAHAAAQAHAQMPGPMHHHHHHGMHHPQQAMWHARSYESGIGVYKRFSKLLEGNSRLPRQQPPQDKRLLHQPRKS